MLNTEQFTQYWKSIVLSFASLLLSLSAAQAEDRFVRIPIYTSNGSIQIDSIKTTEKAITLYCRAGTSTPPLGARVTISSQCYLRDESEKVYKLIDSEGIRLDEVIYYPKPIEFALHFEPLSNNETVFDFYMNSNEQSKPAISSIFPYKPESVRPFTCKITGKIVGLPDCKEVYLSLNGRRTNGNGAVIPVINGKFEHENEYNFSEEYIIYPAQENTMQREAQIGVFCAREGTINITFYTGDAGIKFDYEGQSPCRVRFETDTLIFRQYYDIVEENKGNISNGIITPNMLYLGARYYTEKNAVSEKYRAKVENLKEEIRKATSFVASVTRDSLMTEMVKMERLPDFFSEETRHLIEEMEKAEKREIERSIEYYSENPSEIKLLSLSSSINRMLSWWYPSVLKHRYFPFKGEHGLTSHLFFAPKKEADAILNQYIEIFENIYKPLMPYHPECIETSDRVSSHRKRFEQIERLFEACSKIKQPVRNVNSKDSDKKSVTTMPNNIASAYNQLAKIIEASLLNKSDEGIKYINIFEKDFLPKYPDHPTTCNVLNTIKIITDEMNPNKWTQQPPISDKIDMKGLILAFNYDMQYQQ